MTESWTLQVSSPEMTQKFASNTFSGMNQVSQLSCVYFISQNGDTNSIRNVVGRKVALCA